MSSPAPSNEGDAPKNNQEQITFRFCSECSNMLYPKEDEDAHKLQFTCRTCQYTEEATSSCVFRNVMNNAVGETAGVTQDVGSDPTVRSDVSSYQPLPSTSTSTSTSTTTAPPLDDTNLAICLRCGVTLLHCQSCKEPATVPEYNQFIAEYPGFGVRRSINLMEFSNVWGYLDAEEQAKYTDKFLSCGQPNVPKSSSAGEADDLASLLMGQSFGASGGPSDADPPEACEDPDDNDTYIFD